MAETVVKIKNLCKKFGPVMAVDNISFEINKGEILGLLGPNGAGKTTTIMMMLDIIEPTSGSVEIFGKDLKTHREEILQMTNFSSSYNDFPSRLTLAEILTVFANLYQVEDKKKQIDGLLARFDLSAFRNKAVRQLSSGQLTRLSLCKALINRPRLLLLDEPTASLDPDIADRTRQFIKKIQKKHLVSILFTSHNMAEVEEVCDRVIFLDKGRIMAEDTPAGLSRKIKDVRVKLKIKAEPSRVDNFMKQHQYQHWFDNGLVVVKIDEGDVGQLLGRLSQEKLKYYEITIDKPTLEDYFLQVARK